MNNLKRTVITFILVSILCFLLIYTLVGSIFHAVWISFGMSIAYFIVKIINIRVKQRDALKKLDPFFFYLSEKPTISFRDDEALCSGIMRFDDTSIFAVIAVDEDELKIHMPGISRNKSIVFNKSNIEMIEGNNESNMALIRIISINITILIPWKEAFHERL